MKIFFASNNIVYLLKDTVINSMCDYGIVSRMSNHTCLYIKIYYNISKSKTPFFN
jgi:hypothetical protein